MKKLLLTLIITSLYINGIKAQKKLSSEEKIWKQIHSILSDSKSPKDSLLIYALNFELSVSKKNGKALAFDIVANDSLAYKMFPRYKKLKLIDFYTLMRGRDKIKVILPIIVFGSSDKQKKYKDKDGRVLINFNAAVNAAMAINYTGIRYSNENDAEKPFSQVLNKPFKSSEALFIDAVFMRPYMIEIFNIE